MKKILIVLMCILLSGVAHAGPFGTSEGDGLDRYPGAESLGDNTYVVYSLPKSHPDFDTFLLTIPEKYGLVKIQALSKTTLLERRHELFFQRYKNSLNQNTVNLSTFLMI